MHTRKKLSQIFASCIYKFLFWLPNLNSIDSWCDFTCAHVINSTYLHACNQFYLRAFDQFYLRACDVIYLSDKITTKANNNEKDSFSYKTKYIYTIFMFNFIHTFVYMFILKWFPINLSIICIPLNALIREQIIDIGHKTSTSYAYTWLYKLTINLFFIS